MPLSRTSFLRCLRHDQDRIRRLLLRHLQYRVLSCCVFGVRERQRGINTEYDYFQALCKSPALPCVGVAEEGRGGFERTQRRGGVERQPVTLLFCQPQAPGEARTVEPKRVISVNLGARPQPPFTFCVGILSHPARFGALSALN